MRCGGLYGDVRPAAAPVAWLHHRCSMRLSVACSSAESVIRTSVFGSDSTPRRADALAWALVGVGANSCRSNVAAPAAVDIGGCLGN